MKMNKIITFMCMLFVFVVMQTKAQETQPFAPIGAKWTYGIYSTGATGYSDYPRYLTVIGDTIINGKICSIIEETGDIQMMTNFVYVYQENKKVYVWNEQISDFYLLYDFSANIGDSWKIAYSNIQRFGLLHSSDTLIVFVNNVNNIEYNGIQLKQLDVSYSPRWEYAFGDKITERIGGNLDFFPFFVLYYDWNEPYLRCYSDTDIDIQFIEFACDSSRYVNYLDGEPYVKTDNELIHYNNQIELSENLFSQTDKILMYNAIGQCVLSIAPSSKNISTQSLQNGIYIVVVYKNDGNINLLKFIKYE